MKKEIILKISWGKKQIEIKLLMNHLKNRMTIIYNKINQILKYLKSNLNHKVK